MKKVLYVATTAKTHINTFHLPYIQWFKQNNWIVDVATNGDAKVPFADTQFRIPICRSPLNVSNIQACMELVGILKRGNYDLISCHTPVGGALARIASRITNSKYVMYTAHGFHFFQGGRLVKNLVYKSVERFLARWTDLLITINEEDFNAACEFRLKTGGKVHKLYGIGVDTVRFKNTAFTREQLGLDQKDLVYINIGEMITRKNQANLIRAFAQVNMPNSKLIICGEGELSNKLKTLARTLAVERKVLFLGFRNDIPQILTISDIFVFPSFQEGLPVSIIEAMAAGLPVICSDVRGCHDLINDQGGFVLHPKDTDGFSFAMKTLANDPLLRERLGEYNKNLVKKYDIKQSLNDMADIIVELDL